MAHVWPCRFMTANKKTTIANQDPINLDFKLRFESMAQEMSTILDECLCIIYCV